MDIDVRDVTREIEKHYIEIRQELQSQKKTLTDIEKAEINGKLLALSNLHAHYLKIFYEKQEKMMETALDSMHPTVKKVIQHRIKQINGEEPTKQSEPIEYVKNGRIVKKKFNDFGKHTRA